MKHDLGPIPALIDQLIAALLAFFGVPAAMVLRVMAGVPRPARFARLLQTIKDGNWTIRRDGDTDEILEARLRRIAWVAEDPCGALRHLARSARGWKAYRYAAWGLTPRPVVRVLGSTMTNACAFDSRAPDTS